MRYSTLLGLAASLSTAAAQYKGFNYGNTLTTGAAKTQQNFEDEFKLAQGLPGASGFTSARLYTMIQHGTTNTPVAAIQAAIDTKTQLLLGLWASAGQDSFNNEVAALTAAIQQYGTAFTDLIVGISVGSEDLYRISPTGIENKSGLGCEPSTLIAYITQVRDAIKGTAASGKPIGHVDTWTAFVNGSNADVISALDWLGFDGYPYFQNTQANSIGAAKGLFQDSWGATKNAAQGKDVWITETGWPVSGPDQNQAQAGTANAKTYWDEVGCDLLFGKVNTFWYTLQDALPDVPSPSFGVVGGDGKPLFDLSCSASGSSTSSGAADDSATSTPSSGSSSSSDSDSASGSSSGSSSGSGSSSSSSSSGAGGNSAADNNQGSSGYGSGSDDADAVTVTVTRTSYVCPTLAYC